MVERGDWKGGRLGDVRVSCEREVFKGDWWRLLVIWIRLMGF